VFFGGDSAFGPKNIIWAVAHGHAAAISIDLLCRGEDMGRRPPPHVTLVSQKMGIHEWSYDNAIVPAHRFRVPLKETKLALKSIKIEVELGFDPKLAFAEAQRCLNCDVQTVFADKLCIECDACVDICPMDCINFTSNGDEADLRPSACHGSGRRRARRRAGTSACPMRRSGSARRTGRSAGRHPRP